MAYSTPPARGAAQPADPRGRHRGRAGTRPLWSRRLGHAAMAVMTLLSVTTLLGAGYLWYNARGIDNAGKRLTLAVGATGTAGSAGDIDGKAQNILLVGVDDRSNMTDAEVRALQLGRDGGSMATDTMMIVHVPADGSKATLISLPRDSYVPIAGLGGDGKDKINSAYSYGYNREAKNDPSSSTDMRREAGINLMLGTVTNLTGLTIDHYIQVSLLGFYRISNAVGGIPVNLCQSVNDTVEYNLAHGEDGGSGFDMTAGPHVLQGVTALEFVRQRHNLPAGDLDRVKRQQYFLTAAFRQVAKVGVVFQLNAIKNALTDSIITDSGLKLFSLAQQMANLSANNIIGRTIPTSDGTGADGSSVLLVNLPQVRAYVAGLVNPPKPTPAPAPPAAPTGAAPSTSGTQPAGTPTPAPSSSAPLDSTCVN